MWRSEGEERGELGFHASSKLDTRAYALVDQRASRCEERIGKRM
jgi:hypothetical protein